MSWIIQELALSNVQPKFWLAKRNKEIVCRLKELDNRSSFDYDFKEVSELNGTLPYYVERKHKLVRNSHIDKFKEKMLIKMEILGAEFWFTIEVINKSDNDGLSLNFTAYSYEFALNGKQLYEIELEPATIEDNFEKVLADTAWRLTYVDSPLSEKYRKFNFSTGTSVLNAIKEMASEYDGILQFDHVNREIAIYHPDTICSFEDFMINEKNYIKSLEDNRDGQSIVTRITAIGEDNMMFNSVSPSGQSYADDLSYFMEGYEEDENGNVVSSSDYMSDGLCHNILRMIKVRDEIQPLMTQRFNELKMYQTELVPLENSLSDATLERDTVDMKLDILRNNDEYYYQHKQDETFVEEVRAGYYVMQARSVKTRSGKISVSHTYGSFSIDVTANWQIVRMDLFEDYNFDPDHDKEKLNVAIQGDVEYMMVRVHKKDYSEETNPFIDKDGNWIVNGNVVNLEAASTNNTLATTMSLNSETVGSVLPRISTLAATSYSLSSITQSYFKTAMQTYINRVKSEIAQYNDPIVIPMITDTHYTENSLRSAGHKKAHERGLEYAKLQIEMDNYITADAFVHTGDIVDGRATLNQTVEELNTIVNAYGNITAPKFLVRGNHDTNYLHYGMSGENKQALAYDPTHFLPNAQGKAILGKYWTKDGIKTDSNNTDAVYGYKDITSKNLRIIMLDSYDLDESLDSSGKRIYSPRDYAGYRQRQLDWLVTTLKNTPNSYSVLVFMHVSPTKGFSPAANEFNFKAVNEILKAFNRKGTVNYSFTHKHYGATINTTFTGTANRLIATIAGHEHSDKYERDSLIDTNVPNIVRTCATPAYHNKELRGMGVPEETAFDTVLIDKESKTIKFLRFGFGNDFSTTFSTPIVVPDSGEEVNNDDLEEVIEERPTSNTILDQDKDQYLSDEELLLKYNVMYHNDQVNYYNALVEYKKADIERINEELKILKEQTNEEYFLTEEQILEKNDFIFDYYYVDEDHFDEKEMYDDTLEKLKEYGRPSINMTIDIHNFMKNEAHQRNWNKLKLGKKIRVKHGELDIYSEAVLSKITFDFESEDISITITDAKDIDDPNKKLVNLLKDISSVSNMLNLKKKIYDDAVLKANAADKYMKGRLDASLQRIHAGVNESVEISNRGIVLKSIDYPLDVVMMNSGVIGLSKDGGQTLSTAIDANGIVAEEIVGKIMISQKVHIEDDDGIVKIKGDQIKISTPNPDPVDRVVLGQYEKDKYGLKIDNGALEIVGGLLPEHIERAMSETGYYLQLTTLDGYDFAFEDSEKTLVCRIYDGNRKDITDEISAYAFKWEKIHVESKQYDTSWANSMVGKGSSIKLTINEADCIIRCRVEGIRLDTLNSANIYFGTVEQSFTKNEYNGFKREENIRGDLNLEAPLPTSIKMNENGITAYTNVSDQHYARFDYRGLYVQNGAIDIRTGTTLNRGVVLNGNGLKGYKSDGNITFSLDTNGILSLFNGGIDIYTVGQNRYRGVRLDSDGLRGYTSTGVESVNLKSSDGSLTLNGGYLKIINGLKETEIDSNATNKWNNAESNAKSYAKEYTDTMQTLIEKDIIEGDSLIRSDLHLTDALPTELLLNGDGITAYRSGDSTKTKFARFDYRGLYVQGGAIDIRTNGSEASRGVVLNSSGLTGYDSSGQVTFSLNSSNGSAYFSGQVYVGDTSAYTQIIDNYLKVYGSYSRTWGQSYSTTERVTLELKEGRMRLRNDTRSRSLYYSDYGISTWADGTGTNTSSGVIEFFSNKFSSTVGLAMYSSGNISLNSSASYGSTIYLNPTNGNSSSSASVIIGYGDSGTQWSTLKVGKIMFPDGTILGGNSFSSLTAGYWTLNNNAISSSSKTSGVNNVRIYDSGSISLKGEVTAKYYDATSTYDGFYSTSTATNRLGAWYIDSSEIYSGSNVVLNKNGNATFKGTATINTLTANASNTHSIGAWNIGSTNINAKNGNIKLGASTGNIECSTINSKTLAQISTRESKKNIEPFEKSGLDIINSSIINNFNYKEEIDGLDYPHIGLIVDEAPLEVINFDGTGVLANEALWINWKATQELSQQLEEEKAKNNVLTDELSELRSEIEHIKTMLNI